MLMIGTESELCRALPESVSAHKVTASLAHSITGHMVKKTYPFPGISVLATNVGSTTDQNIQENQVTMGDEEDLTIYKVVVNNEEQYSIWPVDRENPLGWEDRGPSGSKAECLAYIADVWIDMRPLSLRKHMEEIARQQAKSPQPAPPTPSSEPHEPDELVTRLATGDHPVEVGLQPEKSAEAFKASIDRGYVYIKFPEMKGGLEVGVRVDTQASDWSQADFSKATGLVHVEGALTLNYVNVRVVADFQLNTLTGDGHLVIQE